MYLHARSWGVQPSEFWAMTMGEWFLEYEHHEQGSGTYAGNLTRGDVDELTEWMNS